VALHDLSDPPACLAPRLGVLSLCVLCGRLAARGFACDVGTGFSFIGAIVMSPLWSCPGSMSSSSGWLNQTDERADDPEARGRSRHFREAMRSPWAQPRPKNSSRSEGSPSTRRLRADAIWGWPSLSIGRIVGIALQSCQPSSGRGPRPGLLLSSAAREFSACVVFQARRTEFGEWSCP
jgi:hypothetical protein